MYFDINPVSDFSDGTETKNNISESNVGWFGSHDTGILSGI
jgi:hypothetical protein